MLFYKGSIKGKSKGLLKIAKELKISLHYNIKLKELKELLGRHKAFQNVRKSLITIFNIIAPSFVTVFSNQNWKNLLSNIILKLRSLLNFIVSSTAERSTKNLFYSVLLFYIQHISLYSLTVTFLCAIYHPPLPLLRVRVRGSQESKRSKESNRSKENKGSQSDVSQIEEQARIN